MGKKRAETAADRIDRLKRKFTSMTPLGRVVEYARYLKAFKGECAHAYPRAFVLEAMEALWSMIAQDFPDRKKREKCIEMAMTRKPRPFPMPSRLPRPKR